MRRGVLLAGSVVGVCVLGMAQRKPCESGSGFDWVKPARHACYSDIWGVYGARGLGQGKVPYFSHTGDMPFEYPALTGWLAAGVNAVARPLTAPGWEGRVFFYVVAVIFTMLAAWSALRLADSAGTLATRAGLMFALSPALGLAIFLNFDMLAVALATGAIAAWADRRVFWAGVLLGLAVAAKLYPVVFLLPFGLLCARAGRWREFGTLLAATAGTWLAVNAPLMLFAPEWTYFYTFSRERGADWGSLYQFANQMFGAGLYDVDRVNLYSAGSFGVLCLLIALLAWFAPRPPRLAQLLFLVVAAFLLTNKVWSPQYVLWLLPLVVLARPKLPLFLLWQAAEITYYLFHLWHVADVAGTRPYEWALLGRAAAVVAMTAAVVLEILRPSLDAVRAAGDEDPAGGVLAEDHSSGRSSAATRSPERTAPSM